MSKLPTQEKKRRQRLALFRLQNGLCHWCHKPMRLNSDGSAPRPGRLLDAATIDHLHPKGNPDRGKHPDKYLHVLACWKCNHDRNVTYQAQRPKAELWALSGRAPRPHQDS